MLLTPGTSPWGCSHTTDVTPWTCSSPQGRPQAPTFTVTSPFHQDLVLEPAAKRAKAENARHANVLKQANNHQSTVLKQWRSLCRLLTSPRSAWADR